MASILTVEHLSVSFVRYNRGLSQVKLVPIRDLSLTVELGQVTAIVGASGSGKSLLAHAIFHILPQNSQVGGNIYYDGALLTRQRAVQLRGREIALIPQGITYLDPMMRVGPQIRGGRRDIASNQKILNRYGLNPEVEELYPFELSGGMARRVLIATATAQSPRLIVADEPTPGLDMQTARCILDHFQELAKEGAGVLLITHDVELALMVAHKVVVFYDGQTVDQLSAAQLRSGEGLTHPYTQALWKVLSQGAF